MHVLRHLGTSLCVLATLGGVRGQRLNQTSSTLTTTATAESTTQSSSKVSQSSIPATISAPATLTFANSSAPASVYSLVNSAFDCILDISRWSDSAKGTWVSTELYLSTFTETTYTYTSTIWHTSLTTLCDGVPRAVITTDPASELSLSYSTAPQRVLTLTNSSLSYSGTPPCTVSPDPASSYCKQFQEVYNSRLSSAYLTPGASSFQLQNKFPKFCTVDTEPVAPYYGHLTDVECFVSISSAQLYYWSTSKPSNFCNWTATTNPPRPDGQPETVILNGTTLTSPSAYVYLHSLSYLIRSMQSTTRRTMDTMLAFRPDELKSVCGYRNEEGEFPMNYADFQDPVPWSAWACQPYCFGRDSDRCKPLGANLAANYRPQLSVPGNFSTVLAGLGLPSDCTLHNVGWPFTAWHDPPQMLKPADHLLEPKPTSAPMVTTADPAPTQVPPSPSSPPVLPPVQTAAPMIPPPRPTALPVDQDPAPAPSDPVNDGQSGQPQIPADSTSQGAVQHPAQPSSGGSDPQSGSGVGTGSTSNGNNDSNGPSDPGNNNGAESSGGDAASEHDDTSPSRPPVIVIGGLSTLTAGGAPTTISGHVISIPTVGADSNSGNGGGSDSDSNAGSSAVGSGSGTFSGPGSGSSSGNGVASGGDPSKPIAQRPVEPVVVIDSSTIPVRDFGNMMATAMPELQSAGVSVVTPAAVPNKATARPQPAVVIGGSTTLLAGGTPITVGIRVISMVTGQPTAAGQPGGAAVVIDGSTVPLASLSKVLETGLPDLRSAGMVATTVVASSKPGSTDAAVDGIAGWIMSALGGKPSSARPAVITGSGQNGGRGRNNTIVPFTGDAGRTINFDFKWLYSSAFGVVAAGIAVLAL
ncbi:hypothetical protein BDZ85DRAFT_263062 [Elsinoe ampelina]|uniref:Uncharacterized protein n=1 Tax=Elsinoe ampelina TaxID=302913 RepID=A0A6A6GBP4_9PEZI|nr:hypothetical protein BDZ85DRAFT_263062 [Elsinoe ampelina]